MVGDSIKSTTDYQRIIAQATGYENAKKPRFLLELSEPWMALSGELMVCARTRATDGRGGYHPGGKTELYALRGDSITSTVPNNPPCPDMTSYVAVKPI